MKKPGPVLLDLSDGGTRFEARRDERPRAHFSGPGYYSSNRGRSQRTTNCLSVKELECRNFTPSPPFILMGEETERLGAGSESLGD